MSALEEALLISTTVEEAAVAASEAADELVPGGAAISSEAGRHISGIVNAFNGDHSFQAFALAVLISIARVLGTWGRVPRPTSAVSRLAAVERETRGAIETFIWEQEEGALDHNAEVRSLFYRLTGMVADPPRAVTSLRARVGSELDAMARACLFEGLLVAVMRGGPNWQDEIVLLRAAMDSDPLVASRLANVPFDYVGASEEANTRDVEETLGVHIPARNYDNFWPSELL